jgi:hypothetical protein
VVYGKLEETTRETGSGSRLDASFGAGTGRGDLTFS